MYCLEWATKIQFHYRPEQLLIANDQCASLQQYREQTAHSSRLTSGRPVQRMQVTIKQFSNFSTSRWIRSEVKLKNLPVQTSWAPSFNPLQSWCWFNGPVSSPLTVFQQKTSICVVRLLSESFYSMLSVVRVQSAPRWGEKFDVNVSDVSPLHLTQAALRSFSPPLQRAAVGLLIKWLCLN